MKNFFKKLMSSKSQSKYFSETVQRIGKNNAGFSLVELIVVIAIMAILAAVAVIGVSVYIPKAQKANDEQLAADIEKIMNMYAQSGDLTPGDYVVIYLDKDAVASNTDDNNATTIVKMMEAAYGSNWQKELRLSYADWEMGVIADSNRMESIKNSTFNDDALGNLLGDVQIVTNALGTFLVDSNVTLSKDLVDYMESHGVSVGNQVDENNKNIVSNMTTMFVADYISNPSNINEGADFAGTWGNSGITDFINGTNGSGNFGNAFSDPLAQGAAAYARIEALANYVDNKTKGADNTNYASMLPRENELKDVTNYSLLLDKINLVEAEIMSNHFPLYCEYYGITYEGTIPSNGATAIDDGTLANYKTPAEDVKTPAANDAEAFLTYMEGLSETVDTLVQNTDLNSGNYFNDGYMQQYVENYISVGQILASIGDANNAFVFIYDGNDVVCAPLDY